MELIKNQTSILDIMYFMTKHIIVHLQIGQNYSIPNARNTWPLRQVPVPRVLSPSPDPGDLTPRPRPRLEMLEEPLEVLAAVAQASARESGEGNFRNARVHQIHVDIDIIYVS